LNQVPAKSESQTRASWASLLPAVIGWSLLGSLFLMMPGSVLQDQSLKLYYSVFAVPVIFIVLAVLLAWRTRTMPGLQFSPKERHLARFTKYSVIIIVLKLAFIGLAILVDRSVLAQLAHLSLSDWLSLGTLRSLLGSPIAEELLYRGWLLTYLQGLAPGAVSMGRLKLTEANLLNSISFALLHLANGLNMFNILIAFMFGLVLGAAREESGGLLLPMWCHFLANL